MLAPDGYDEEDVTPFGQEESLDLITAFAGLRGLSEPALLRAKAAGLCRRDLQLSDISLISGMLGAALRGRTVEDRATLARRAIELLRPGLSVQAATERT